ncbi:hypothetical protein DL98DRAFT_525691 [Cadophora sp. DSE1049]|nr:hypothetical protein DL98DRAFT_525691 [Cadophora sp. DSE1049]
MTTYNRIGTKKRSSGCIPCKARKKKCDGRKPICVGCERNILLCRWSGSEEGSPLDGASASKSVGISLQKDTPSMSPKNSGVLVKRPGLLSTVVQHPLSKLLYEHWFGETADNISALRGTSNAFYTELPKLALRYSDMVLPSLLAFSGVHYCNKYPNPAVEEMAWSHLAQALRALKYAVTRHVAGSDDDQALPLLVTTLMMSLIETCRGDTEGNYKHHSRAARPLLRSVLASGLYDGQDSTINFVMELYAYVACITDLTVEADAVVVVKSDSESNFDQVINSHSSGILLGCAYELFQLVPLVSDLRQRQYNAGLSPERTQTDNNDWLGFLEECSALHLQISTWEPPPGATSDFANGGRLYQEALLAYLEMSISDAVDLEVVKRTEVAMALLNDIPQNAPIAVTLYWPLSLFASITDNLQHRKTIKQRFKQMYDDLGIGNILTIIEFLDRLWDRQQTATELRNNHPVQSTSLQSLTRKHGTDISFL